MYKSIKRPALFLASFIAIYFLAFQLGFSYTNISHFLSKQAETSKYLEFNKTESQDLEFKFDANLNLYCFSNFIEQIVFSNLQFSETCSFITYAKVILVSTELYDLFHQWKYHLSA
ncbi:MAG TPA: hypothetical protein VIL57_07785 [Bacteroidia bacterium]